MDIINNQWPIKPINHKDCYSIKVKSFSSQLKATMGSGPFCTDSATEKTDPDPTSI